MNSTHATQISSTQPRFELNKLREEWESLTEEEREEAERDLTGQNTYDIDETSNFIAEKISELTEYIEDNIHEANREAYDTAQLICPDYVNSTDFLLMFLRSQFFDVPKTAERLVLYWDKKVDLFGVDYAFRKLSLGDFTQEDRKALCLGGFRVLPEKDDFGRPIFYMDRALWDQRPTNRSSMTKLAWYMVHVALEDSDAQKKGVVALASGVDKAKTGGINFHDSFRDRLIWKALLQQLPIRWVAFHHILRANFNILLPQFLSFLKPRLRSRYRMHDGTSASNYMHELKDKYGLPRHILPPDIGGTLDFRYDAWLNERIRNGF